MQHTSGLRLNLRRVLWLYLPVKSLCLPQRTGSTAHRNGERGSKFFKETVFYFMLILVFEHLIHVDFFVYLRFVCILLKWVSKTYLLCVIVGPLLLLLFQIHYIFPIFFCNRSSKLYWYKVLDSQNVFFRQLKCFFNNHSGYVDMFSSWMSHKSHTQCLINSRDCESQPQKCSFVPYFTTTSLSCRTSWPRNITPCCNYLMILV